MPQKKYKSEAITAGLTANLSFLSPRLHISKRTTAAAVAYD